MLCLASHNKRSARGPVSFSLALCWCILGSEVSFLLMINEPEKVNAPLQTGLACQQLSSPFHRWLSSSVGPLLFGCIGCAFDSAQGVGRWLQSRVHVFAPLAPPGLGLAGNIDLLSRCLFFGPHTDLFSKPVLHEAPQFVVVSFNKFNFYNLWIVLHDYVQQISSDPGAGHLFSAVRVFGRAMSILSDTK